MVLGAVLAVEAGLKPVYTLGMGRAHYGIYIGVIALAANFAVAMVATPIAVRLRSEAPADRTADDDYRDAAA
jgi:hypothetical protein